MSRDVATVGLSPQSNAGLNRSVTRGGNGFREPGGCHVPQVGRDGTSTIATDFVNDGAVGS